MEERWLANSVDNFNKFLKQSNTVRNMQPFQESVPDLKKGMHRYAS
jgi:hypothetical protein